MPGLLRAVNHLLKRNGISSSQPDNAVYFYYDQVVKQARNPIFYEKYDVPDTLEGRFDCVSLHMAMLMIVLKYKGAIALSQPLFDLFFADVDRNLREIGVGDLSVGRQVKKLASNFYGVLEAYEVGLSNESLLIKALTTNLYGGLNPSSEKLKFLIAYVQESIGTLSKIKFDQGYIQIALPELR